jgi:subtilisin family serine protease
MLRRISAPALCFALAALVGCDSESTATLDRSSASDKDAPASALATDAPADAPSATELPGTHAVSAPIKDQYIITLDESALARGSAKASVESLAADVLVQAGARGLARVERVYTHALVGFTAQNLSAEEALRVQEDPRVLAVEQDQMMYANATQSNAPWGLDRIDDRSGRDGTYVYDETGSGVTVFVLDTGIRTSHNDFGGRAYASFDAVGDGRNGQDCNGHGTHVAGTVGGSTYGVAKGATLAAVRVLGCNGSGSNSGVIGGVDHVAQSSQRPAVANMSLGGGASSALDNAVRGAVQAGVTFVVAAGNESQNACNVSPARESSAITVGSTTSSDSRSSFSNYGSCVDIMAPGSSITSAWYTSNSSTNTISGTSMASPHVAGAAALVLGSNGSASPSAVENALNSAATTGALSGLNGSPNRLLYVGSTGGGGGGGGTPPPSSAPCTNCSAYSGSLSGSNDSDVQPNGTYYAGSGTQRGYLRGPSNADFDLELYRWSGSGWSRVARSISSTSSEDITYSGASSGYYYWRVRSYSGSGSYDFWIGN